MFMKRKVEIVEMEWNRIDIPFQINIAGRSEWRPFFVFCCHGCSRLTTVCRLTGVKFCSNDQTSSLEHLQS